MRKSFLCQVKLVVASSMSFQEISKRACSAMITLHLLPSARHGKVVSSMHCQFIRKFSNIQNLYDEPSSSKREFFRKEAIVKSQISLSMYRTSRSAIIAARTALFDYLHCTRGYSFLDAENISKNSPQFLQYLIMQVEREQEVSKALTKFFRYHPINEFEPFFESLGLRKIEFTPFLPRNLIFLSDDQTLLDNYHALSVYGFPRSNIGRMFMGLNEIFGYTTGALDLKLRAYEKLGLSKSTVIKLVSCSPLLLVGDDVNSAFAGILKKLKELGFESNWIGENLLDKSICNWDRILDGLCFLIEIGYTDEKLVDLLSKNTALLFEGFGKQIYVFVGSLLKLGLNMNKICSLFLNNSQLLSRKCAKNIWKVLHFFLEIRMEPENITEIFCSHMPLLVSLSLKGPKTVLKAFNGDKHSLCETITKDPSTFFSLAFKEIIPNPQQAGIRNPSNVFEKTNFLLRIGYVENSDEMTKALKRFRGRGDQLQERFDCLVKAGLDFNAVISMVKHVPTLLNQTKDVLEKKIEYLKNYLGYPLVSIVKFPSYLCYDMERISLRFSMYIWLREKGAANPSISISTLLACSDARFVKYFVEVHPEGPVTWETLKISLSST